MVGARLCEVVGSVLLMVVVNLSGVMLAPSSWAWLVKVAKWAEVRLRSLY